MFTPSTYPYLSSLDVSLVTPCAATLFTTCPWGRLVTVLLFRPTVLPSPSVLLSSSCKTKVYKVALRAQSTEREIDPGT